jgi:GT2 family glycosyltransferase
LSQLRRLFGEKVRKLILLLCNKRENEKMISIITAIHNGKAMNKIFLHYLKKYTHHSFELIIIDNNSTDGSKEFFKSNNAIVIENAENFSYPHCQNQGIKAAKYDILAFLNNDIIVSPQWDKKLIDIAEKNNLEIITPCGIEHLENSAATLKISRRWKAIKNFISLAGINTTTLKLMFQLMYGNWEKFNEERFRKFGDQVREGFVGNTVLMKRNAVQKLGMWDEKIQSADFDLFIRSKKRNLEIGDIKPIHIAWGVFNHHFIRLTLKSKPVEFADKSNLILIEEKWGKEYDRYINDEILN